MQTQTAQIKFTLPINMMDYVQAKADKFGLPVAAYVRNLVFNDVKDDDIPVFQASKRVEEKYKQSLEDEKNGNYIEVESTEELFNSLLK